MMDNRREFGDLMLDSLLSFLMRPSEVFDKGLSNPVPHAHSQAILSTTFH